MPTFDFSLPKKETKARKTSNNIKRTKVVEENIIGIVWIDINANFTVKVNNSIDYKIHADCYSCKGKDRIYTRELDNNRRCCIIRSINDYGECNPNYYLPFAPGCVVSGDIVIIGFIKYFYIKKCWVELYNNNAHDALAYYRENYDTILSVIENNKINGTQ